MRLIIALLLLTFSIPALSAKILIIGSYHASYPWELDYNLAIKDTLGDNHSYYHYHMDTKRIQPEAYQARADEAWELYLAVKPDLVFLGDDNAVKYLHQRLRATQTPVVYLGINQDARHYKLNEADNFTGVLERPLFKRSIILAQQLIGKRPNPKVLVLFDSGITSQVTTDYITKKKETVNIGETQLDIKSIDNYEHWQQLVSNAKDLGYTAIFIGLYQTLKDSKGEHVPELEVLSWTRQHASVPHFGFWSFSIGKEGNIGGYVLDGYVHGVNAATLGRRLLAGTKPRSLFPKTDSTGRYVLSRSGIKKWQLTIPDNVLRRAVWVE